MKNGISWMSMGKWLIEIVVRSANVLGDFSLGVPAIAVGLSAISLLASFPPRSKKTEVHSPKSEVRNRFAKDAAPIPNALEAPKLRILALKPVAEPVHKKKPTYY